MVQVDPRAEELVSFYINRPPTEWFIPPEGLDMELMTRFGHLVDLARTTDLDSWSQTSQGALAMIILLDQIPRNIYRNSPLAFSSDGKALLIASQSVAKGFDQQCGKLNKAAQTIFYLPFEHSEDLVSQIAAVALFRNFTTSCQERTAEKDYAMIGVASAQRHLDCILKLGRFPKRNEALGRETTPEELEFLEQHPNGF